MNNTQQQRINVFVPKMQKLNPSIKIDENYMIKNQSIAQICQYSKTYERLSKWVDKKLTEKAYNEVQPPKLFDKPVEPAVQLPTIQLSLGAILIAYKIGKISVEETALIIKEIYGKK